MKQQLTKQDAWVSPPPPPFFLKRAEFNTENIVTLYQALCVHLSLNCKKLAAETEMIQRQRKRESAKRFKGMTGHTNEREHGQF